MDDDIDGDGADCDPRDPAAYPEAPELCDREDNDCDGFADEQAGCEYGCGAIVHCLRGCPDAADPSACEALCHSLSLTADGEAANALRACAATACSGGWVGDVAWWACVATHCGTERAACMGCAGGVGLQRAAADSGFPVDSLEKVWMLVRLLNMMRAHPFMGRRVALKGGTALNLFVFDAPRLSVDIDINYVGARSRRRCSPQTTT